MWTYIECLRKYAKFNGRSRRKEYWMFVLFVNLIFLSLLTVSSSSPVIRTLLDIYLLAMIVPGIAVSIRRLHDTDRSGLWIFINLVPLGTLIFLYFMVVDSQPGDNEYGPNPKGVSASPSMPSESALKDLNIQIVDPNQDEGGSTSNR